MFQSPRSFLRIIDDSEASLQRQNLEKERYEAEAAGPIKAPVKLSKVSYHPKEKGRKEVKRNG
jgi:hypothetical protein